MGASETREHIKWIDTAKFLGIFAIWLGHLGEDSGLAYKFVFTYHVPFFFFLSGCMSNYDHESSWGLYIKKKVKRILVPFWIFSILSIGVFSIISNSNLREISEMLVLVAKGNIRNSFVAPQLWFLSCLFVIEVIFKVIKCIRVKSGILIVCLGSFWISECVIAPRPILTPHWFYNVDSAMYYIIFFAIGYILYPYILQLFCLNSSKKVIFF